MDQLLAALQEGASALDLRPIGEPIGLTPDEAADAAASVMLLASLATETNLAIGEFGVLEPGRLFDQTDQQVAGEIADRVLEIRSSLESGFQRSSLTTATLPSFTSISLSIDLRLQFEGNRISGAAPVAVAHLTTDTDAQIWLQFSAADLRQIIERLETAKERVQLAETVSLGLVQSKLSD